MKLAKTSKNNLNPIDIFVRGEPQITRNCHHIYARLIVRERKSENRYGRIRINRYLYLVYRAGNKIKEHYIAKLSDEKI